ncbi:hypothetical protein [Streptomyces aureoverticillatus]|uniref:hypothetical protein n=1 Tax=Streptomyces aureoverticillatus TaxID=66871 RepID=UPI0013D905B8|nr:hypothetical protein [Streptomyces aureoverticillatus]QIB49530.1 hypothetical protein G3H79_40900 [Streptomyces aureoverticillatus]
MSGAATAVRIGRTYTRARRHPWVLGKIGDWTLPLGPYTPAQLTIAAVGIFALIKTFSWWAPSLGPVPVVGLGVAVWLARASRLGGRAPLWVAYGWAQFALQPSSGRINGRTVRPRSLRALHGTFLIEHTTATASAGPAAAAPRTRHARPTAAAPAGPAAVRRWRWPRAARSRAAAPVVRPAPTPLQQLLRERQEAGR